MLKKLLVLGLLVTVGLFFTQGASAQEKLKKVGIVQFSDEDFFVEGLKGVLAQMKKQGFDESKVLFDIRNAKGKKDKAIEIIKEFKEKGLNLVIAMGTESVIAAYNEIKDIPIVFSTVFDPVGSGVAKSWNSSGNNTTGSSTWVDMSSIVSVIRKICPGKRIGIIYTEEEKNTVLQVEELKKIQTILDFSVIPANLDKVEDAVNVANSLVGRVDCIFITGGTVVGRGLEAILGVIKKAKLPTIAHLQTRAKQGVLIVLAANSFNVGELAGKKVVQVLNGVKPSLIPIEIVGQYDITINLKTAKEIGLKIPDSLLKRAAKVIE